MELRAGDKLHIRAIIGELTVNEFMKAVGLRPEYKVYASQQDFVVTVDGTVLDPALVLEGLLHSMQRAYIVASLQCRRWVRGDAELSCSGLTYTNHMIREISDGVKVRFVQHGEPAC